MKFNIMDAVFSGPLLSIQWYQMCLKSEVPKVTFLSDNAIISTLWETDVEVTKTIIPKKIKVNVIFKSFPVHWNLKKGSLFPKVEQTNHPKGWKIWLK